MTDHDALGDETSDSLTALGKGIRNALLIELGKGIRNALLMELALGFIVWLVWRIAT